MTRIDILLPERDLLGECPLWDDRTQALYWIDGRGERIRRHVAATGETTSWATAGHVGSIALTERGRLLVALDDRFELLDPASGDSRPFGERVTHAADRMRLNDGRCDRAGRFVVGSMTMGRHEPLGALYQLSPDGRVRVLDTGVQLANATCFSPDGRWLYFGDSPTHALRRHAYDPASGDCGPGELLVDTTPYGSPPDGAGVDADGNIWVALVRAGKLACFAPDGRYLRAIDFAPDAFITCPCFGGAALDVIYLTSISNSGNLLVSSNPDAGAVFVIRDSGARGLPEARFDDRQVA